MPVPGLTDKRASIFDYLRALRVMGTFPFGLKLLRVLMLSGHALRFCLPRRIARPLFPETAPPIEPNAGTLTPALLHRLAKHALRA